MSGLLQPQLRVLLGPRVGVRDYTLLQQSSDLELAGGEHGTLQAFLSAARKVEGEFFAFFSLGEGARWVLLRSMGRMVTEGLAVHVEGAVLDELFLDRIHWNLQRLMRAWPEAFPADPGARIEFDDARYQAPPDGRGISESQHRAWRKAIAATVSSRPTPILIEVEHETSPPEALTRIWENMGDLRKALSFNTHASLGWSPGRDIGFAVSFCPAGEAPPIGPLGRRLCHFGGEGLVVDVALRREWDAKLWAFENAARLVVKDIADWESEQGARTFEQALRSAFRAGYRGRSRATALAAYTPAALLCTERGAWRKEDLATFANALVQEFEAGLPREPAGAAKDIDIYLHNIEPALAPYLPAAFATRLASESGALLHLSAPSLEIVLARLLSGPQGSAKLASAFHVPEAGTPETRREIARMIEGRIKARDANWTIVASAMLDWFARNGSRAEAWGPALASALLEAGSLAEVRGAIDVLDQSALGGEGARILIDAWRHEGQRSLLDFTHNEAAFATVLTIETAALRAGRAGDIHAAG